MALLELGGKKYTIPLGDVYLGADPSCAVNLAGPGILPKHAVLTGLADGQVAIRKVAAAAEVTINGVRLGAEPTPLLHGDKVQVGGHELTFVDERRSGSTQYVSAVNMAQAAAAAKAEAKGAKPTGNTGGRVVSLTDGREYVVTGTSLTFGREAGCDVVVNGKDVSRRHAEIVSTPKGYLVVDQSTNGTFVNEERVQGQRLLARADVIRIGDENFRFYADAAPAAKSSSPPPGPAASTPPAAPQAVTLPAQAAGAGERLKNTMHGMPASPRPTGGSSTPAPLASFLIRSGALKGTRFQVKTPIVNIGRADYNDLVLNEESISTSHAKLQRREGVWVLVDLESTNGTFVDGDKVSGETPLAPGAMVRFGDVQTVFEPTDDAMGVAKGGGTKVIEAFKTAPKPAAPPAPAPAKPAAKAPAPPPPPPAPKAPPAKRPAAPPSPQKKGKGCGSSAAIAVLALAGAACYLLLS